MSATPVVPIELGGKTRNLRFTNRALVKSEDVLAAGNAGTIRTAQIMLWAGLLHEEPTLTVDQVIDMVEPHQYETIALSIERALNLALGKPSTNGGPEGKGAASD
jgi:hypothetical protein